MIFMKKFPKSMEEFMNNIPHEKLGHNLYFIQCEDKSGNITEEKFGINLITDYGFLTKFKNYNQDDTSFIMGTGTGTPDYTDSAMFEEIASDNTSITVDSQNTPYPSYFNKETNMIIGRKLTGIVTLDYNYSWLTSDVNITEFGEHYGQKYENRKYLITHAMVYDKAGNPSYFTKRMNEKTTIYIFKTCCINADVINNLYDRGLYFFIYPSPSVNPMSGYSDYNTLRYGKFTSGKCCHHDDYPLYPVTLAENMNQSFSDYNEFYNRGFAYAYTGEIDNNDYKVDSDKSYKHNISTNNGYRNDLSTGESIITNKYICSTGLFLATYDIFLPSAQWGSGKYGVFGIDSIFLLEQMNLKEPEELVSEYIWTDDFMTPRFRNAFNMIALNYSGCGYFMKQRGLPVNDFNITSVSRYNALTDAYDIEEVFINDPDYDFRNPERAVNGYYIDSVFGGYNVMVNTNTNIPIIAFRDSYGRKIYATNEYWNPESFQPIEDFNNVPKELQNMRYYIKTPIEQYADRTTYATTLMYPIRESNKHALVPSKAIRELKTETNIYFKKTGAENGKFMYGSNNGWIYIEGDVVYPDSQDENGNSYVHNVKYPEESSSYAKDYWKHLMNSYNDNVIVLIDNAYHNENNQIRMRIIKPDPENPSVAPSYRNYQYSEIFNLVKNPYTEYSDTRFYTRFEKVYGLLYIIRDNWVYYIDTTTEDMISNEIPFQVRTFSPVYGTELFVTRTMDNSAYVFNIYNVRSMDEPVVTFELQTENLEGCYGCFGYYDNIYIQTKVSGTWELVIYNITTGGIKTHTNVLVTPFRTDLGYKNLNAFDCDYDDETIVAKSFHTESYSTESTCCAILLFRNNADNIVYLSKPEIGERTYSCVMSANGRPYIKKLNGGKDYVCIFPGQFPEVSDLSGTTGRYINMIIDIGKIRNKGYRSAIDLCKNCCSPILHMPPSMYYPFNQIYSVTCFYKDSVAVAFSSNFKKNLMIIPIEMFLPHKVTGTTKTIQSYNNPKKINSKKFGIEIKYK